MRGSTNATAPLKKTISYLTVNGCTITKIVQGNTVSYSMQNQSPTDTADHIIDTSVSLPFGLAPIITGGNVLVGYIFIDADRHPVMRTQLASDVGFVATYQLT